MKISTTIQLPPEIDLNVDEIVYSSEKTLVVEPQSIRIFYVSLGSQPASKLLMLERSMLEQFHKVKLIQYHIWSAFLAECEQADEHIEGGLPPELGSQCPNVLVSANQWKQLLDFHPMPVSKSCCHALVLLKDPHMASVVAYDVHTAS